MPTRIMVVKDGPNFKERIGKKSVFLRPLEPFLHPDPERAKVLLALRPVIFTETKELTADEKAAAEANKKAATEVAVEQLSKEAAKKLEAKKKALDELRASMTKMKPEQVAKEATSRGLSVKSDGGEDLAPDVMAEAIIAYEEQKQ